MEVDPTGPLVPTDVAPGHGDGFDSLLAIRSGVTSLSVRDHERVGWSVTVRVEDPSDEPSLMALPPGSGVSWAEIVAGRAQPISSAVGTYREVADRRERDTTIRFVWRGASEWCEVDETGSGAFVSGGVGRRGDAPGPPPRRCSPTGSGCDRSESWRHLRVRDELLAARVLLGLERIST